jgi:hypothetical protein
MLVVGFLEADSGGRLWPPPVSSFIHLLTLFEIHFSASGSGILPLLYSFIYLLFEQIIVFQAGVRRNTLAWNNRIGLCSLFVGLMGTEWLIGIVIFRGGISI